MSDELNEELDSQTEPTEEVEKTEEVEEVVPETPTKDLELEEKNKKLFERAKKAEAELKELKAKAQVPPPPPEKQDGLTSLDTIALINAKVTEKEDIDEVLDYAKLKGIPIQEALKATVVKAILSERAEQRATAEASSTSNARRGTAKLTPEQILENVSKGKFPEDPEALAEARLQARKAKQ